MKSPLFALLIIFQAIVLIARGQSTDELAKEAKIKKALVHFVFPKLEFHEAPGQEALEFLSQKIQSCKIDSHSIPVFTVLPESTDSPATPPLIVGHLSDMHVTVSLTGIPLYEALKYLTGLLNMKFRIQADGVHIVPAWDPDPMFTQDFHVPRNFFPAFEKADSLEGTHLTEEMKKDFRNYLAANGIEFRDGGTAVLKNKGARLTVHTTRDQFAHIQKILKTDRPPPVPGPEVPKIMHGDPRLADKIEPDLLQLMQMVVFPKMALDNVSLVEAASILSEMSTGHHFPFPSLVDRVSIVPQSYKVQAGEATWPTISYSASHVTLFTAIDAIAQLSQRVVRIRSDVVTLEKAGSDEKITRTYLVPPMSRKESENLTSAEKERETAWLAQAPANLNTSSVEFKGFDTPLYVASKHWLIVKDTDEKQRIIQEQMDAAWREYYASHQTTDSKAR